MEAEIPAPADPDRYPADDISMDIRKATRDRLHEIHGVIRESIKCLCTADHLGNPSHIETWLAARSQTELDELILRSDSQGFVCVDANDLVVGVSHITTCGELTLCYVAPTHSGLGIGSKLLAVAESQARNWDLLAIRLTSTTTAKAFYESHGYEPCAETIACFGVTGHPLRKSLSATSTMDTESGITKG